MAFDLGASSGRGILARFDGTKITLEEVHRFPHNFSVLNGRAYWNIISLMDAMKEGLRLCKEPIEGVGFDTWGVDCGLLDAQGNLLGLPGSYRDEALDEANRQEALELLAPEGGTPQENQQAGERYAFEQTGIASLAYNTLYKLYYMKKQMPDQMKIADTVLLMPNLIEYLFCGVKHSEYSIASTTQLYNMKEKRWSKEIMAALDMDPSWFPEADYAGKVLGGLRPEIIREVGHKDLKVVSVSGHDTACAVAAVPAREKEFTFLSSGTWSLLGISSEKMLEGEAVIRDKISNEGTWDGGYRPTVNIIGLWIQQELRRNLQKAGRDYTFPQLAELAAKEPSLRSFIRPDDFMQPGDYPEKIRAYCKATGQPVPESDGELVRCVLESLAMKYRQVYESFKPYITWEEKIYIVGGGVQNQLLNQFTANALGIPVITGASEATAVGNVMEQLQALGAFHTREEKCDILDASFETQEVLPQEKEAWEEGYARFKKLYL